MYMYQRREKEGVVIHHDIVIVIDMHIYATHRLKLGMIKEKKREWLFLAN